MAVIFFEGFTRPLDTHYWTNTNGVVTESTGGSSAAGGSVYFPNSDPVVNNLRLGNIGSHTSKKLYFGIRLQQYFVKHAQPFLKFYDASNNVALTLQWNLNDVANPDVGIQAVTAGGSSLSPFIVDDAIAGVAYTAGTDYRGLFVNEAVLEFELDLTAYTLAVKFNNQALQTVSAVTTLTGMTSAVATITGVAFFGGYNGGTTYDVYLVDDSGSFANTWLGSTFRIHSPTFSGSSSNSYNTNWANQSNNAPTGSEVNDSDSDSTFIRTGTFNEEVAFDLNTVTPSGFNPAIGAIRLRSVARRQVLDAAYKYFYYDSNYYGYGAEMGARMVLTSSAYTAQNTQFINTNPLSGAQWTIDDINDGWFGVKSVDPA
jgi:hypothetical protein